MSCVTRNDGEGLLRSCLCGDDTTTVGSHDRSLPAQLEEEIEYVSAGINSGRLSCSTFFGSTSCAGGLDRFKVNFSKAFMFFFISIPLVRYHVRDEACDCFSFYFSNFEKDGLLFLGCNRFGTKMKRMKSSGKRGGEWRKTKENVSRLHG